MKKTISFFLTLVMVLTLACSVSAEGETGSITISNVALKNNDDTTLEALDGRDYYVYKILDLESYNPETKKYSYKVEPAWVGFFGSEKVQNVYFVMDEAGYVTEYVTEEGKRLSDIQVAEFAKLALEHAKGNDDINVTADTTGTGLCSLTRKDGTTGSLVFSGLDLGYYLIDSTVGSLCGLTTTKPNAEIEVKNDVPTIKKEVKEGETWGELNTAKIGDIVEFKATITVTAGAQNYVLHDAMTEGLTYQGVTEVKLNDKDIVSDDDYTVDASSCSDGCDFEVSFNQNYVDGLNPGDATVPGDTIVVYYTAILNEKAEISPGENTNTSRVQYGENNYFHYTPDATTKTYTYSFDIVKTDSEKKLLDGAKFKIYDAEGNEIKVILDGENLDGEKYRPATPAEKSDKNFQAAEIKVTNGKVTLVGFDKGKYYLEEIEAPAGYNKLNARQEFEIGDDNLGNLSATINGTVYAAGGVQVVNKTGTELPQTGARGTALFITFGMIVVLGAGVLLVTKKRMGMIQD